MACSQTLGVFRVEPGMRVHAIGTMRVTVIIMVIMPVFLVAMIVVILGRVVIVIIMPFMIRVIVMRIMIVIVMIRVIMVVVICVVVMTLVIVVVMIRVVVMICVIVIVMTLFIGPEQRRFAPHMLDRLGQAHQLDLHSITGQIFQGAFQPRGQAEANKYHNIRLIERRRLGRAHGIPMR